MYLGLVNCAELVPGEEAGMVRAFRWSPSLAVVTSRGSSLHTFKALQTGEGEVRGLG